MKSSKPIVLFLVFALACGGIEQQEASYRSRIAELKALSTKAPARAAEFDAAREGFEKEYAALPADAAKRSEQIGKLHKRMREAVEAFEKEVEAQASAGKQDLIAKYAGTWMGDSVNLTIRKDGSCSYLSTKGGVKKTINAPIQEFTEGSFVVGALGITTTFKIDAPIAGTGSGATATIDGTKLTRQ